MVISLTLRCQISLFYIKPQRIRVYHHTQCGCQISLFYIKPQLFFIERALKVSCQISLFYIKPQRPPISGASRKVVKYLFSTSNHNPDKRIQNFTMLSNISFLHQTTTKGFCIGHTLSCQISLFYIKPQRITI